MLRLYPRCFCISRLNQGQYFGTNSYSQHVTFTAFTAIMKQLQIQPDQRPLIAVSGGVDSMTLAFMASQFFKQCFSVTIDHQLRKESKEEAKQVHLWLSQYPNMHHQIVQLEWNEDLVGQAKTQELARRKRYDAIANILVKERLQYLMTAHHGDDQIETLLFRMARGSGLDGLAGMDYSSSWPYPRPMVDGKIYPLTIIRPFLDLPKERLIATSRYHQLSWVEDPTNAKPIYQRNAIRIALAGISKERPDLALTLDEVRQAIVNARLIKKDMNEHVMNILKKDVYFNNNLGYAKFNLAHTTWLNTDWIANRLLNKVIRWIRGAIHPPRLEDILTLIKKLEQYDGKFFMISGCLFALDPNDTQSIWVYRQPFTAKELKTKATSDIYCNGKAVLWDQRYHFQLKGEENLSKKRFWIRPLTIEDVVVIRSNSLLYPWVDLFEKTIHGLNVSFRKTLPVIIDADTHQIAHIPWLDFSKMDNHPYHCIYQHIDVD